MKNRLRIALFALVAMLFPALSYAQQNLLTQTTLAAAITAPAAPGTPPGPYGYVQLASTTGITAITLNQTTTINSQNQWVLYVDREEMAVVGINGTTLQVIRGYNSTVSSAHVSGQMVLYGRANFFFQGDPGSPSNADGNTSGVPCTQSAVLVSPWVNIRSGMQWVCSTDTLTWVPGFNNGYGGLANVASAGTLASIAGTNPVLGPVFAISGTNAIVTFTPPLGFDNTAVGGGCFTTIPKGIFTWTAAGNISVAGTTTAITQNVSFCWNPYTSKWVPSRVA